MIPVIPPRREGFWKQPRWLTDALEDGEINRCEFMLLAYLGGAGADRFGVSTTLGELSSLLGFTTKWISDSLRRLRAKGLIEFDLGERSRRPFRITQGPALRWETDFRTEFRSQTRTATEIEGGDEIQDFRSDEGDFRSGDLSQSQEQSAVAPQATSGTSAVAEIETTTNPCSNDSVGTTSEVGVAHAREDDDLDATDRLLAVLAPFREPTLEEALNDPELFAVYVAPYGELLDPDPTTKEDA